MSDIDELGAYAEKFVEQAQKVRKQTEEERLAQDKRKEKFELELATLSKRHPIDATVIELTVSGTPFTTFKSTLCKFPDTLLSAMFSGRHPLAKDSGGRYVIDRPAATFRPILTWLQTGELSLPRDVSFDQMVSELRYFGLDEAFAHTDVTRAVLFTEEKQAKYEELIAAKAPWGPRYFTQVYLASRDGWGAADFHRLCDNIGPTLLIAKTTGGHIFGAYTSEKWDSTSNYKNFDTTKAFIFALENPAEKPVLLLNTHPSGRTGDIYCNAGYGPTFGGGHDLHICDSANTVGSSYFNIGHDYEVPPNCHYNNADCFPYFVGQKNFLLAELEVFAAFNDEETHVAMAVRMSLKR